MKRSITVFATLALVLAGATSTKASVITGPSLPYNASSDIRNSGLDFTALKDSVLTGFTFSHVGLTGNILLKDVTASTSTTIVSGYAASPLAQTYSGLNVMLIAGHEYQLLQSNTGSFSDGKINDQLTSYFPVSDAEIRVNHSVSDGTDQSTFNTMNTWYDFTNITTAPVPEPVSLAVFGVIGLAGAGLAAWRRRKPV